MKRLFILGSHRSGTTWIRSLIACHPAVASGPELHLFNSYLAGAFTHWDEHAERWPSFGLHKIMQRDDFDALCRAFADGALMKLAAGRTGVELLVDKTPNYAYCCREVKRLFPDAYVLHIVRDPRAVVSSLRAAGRSWARAWAPTGVIAATEHWRRSVVAALSSQADFGDRWIEARYEKVLESPADELERVFGRIGLGYDRALCESAARECSFERARERTNDRPGFVFRGMAEGWRADLGPADVQVVEWLAGPLMDRLGYARCAPTARRPPMRIALWIAARRLASMLERAAKRVTERYVRGI